MAHANILCVYDDGAKINTPLIGSKGKSLLIDVDGQKTLFDTGLRGRYFKHNLEHLSVKFSDIDRVVISHASAGHIGGLNTLLENKPDGIDIYAHDSVWSYKKTFSKLVKDEFQPRINMKSINDWVQLSEHLFITPPINGIANESALVLKTAKGAVVISACSHGGLVDTLTIIKEKFGKIHAIVGGIHLNKVKQPAVKLLAEEIKEICGTPEMYLNGCTTGEGIQKMRIEFSINGVEDFFVGYDLDFVL